jgi:hypothetical protein
MTGGSANDGWQRAGTRVLIGTGHPKAPFPCLEPEAAAAPERGQDGGGIDCVRNSVAEA